jgi:two-component system, response regulator YesN
MYTFKMLIVDDEALARYAFKTLISKNFINIEIVGEAESGNQAVEMVRALKPDIVAMDIKMPGINGIEASEEILNQFPDTSILILTAYDNFGYVQKALDMGVKGYLLKPFKKEQVIEKINIIINSIDGKKESKDIHKQIENKIKVVKPFMERELISAIISGNIDADEIGSYINFLQGHISSGYFMLVSFEQSNTENINDSIRNKIYREKIQGVLEKHLPKFKECIFGSPIGNLIVAFIIIREAAADKIIVNESIAIAKEMKSRVKVITGIDSAIGIGKPYSDIKSFKNSFNEAGIAIKEGIRENGIVHFDSFKHDSVKNEQTYPVALENELLEELRIGNFLRARELAAEIIVNITNGHVDSTLLKEYISMFVIVLKRAILQFGIGIDGLAGAGLISEISSIEERDELIFWCKTNVFRIIEVAESLKQNKDTSKIKKVHEYINRNLNKDITLEMAADEAGLTPQYFSKVFKEETGKNFVEYLTEKRINYATKLMKSTDKNIKEISKMVGYTDVNYFCRLFKKTTGTTPKQYKEAK